MEHLSLPSLSSVAICGGTHGNEPTGVYIVKEMQRQKQDRVGSVSVTAVLSNPRAVEVCRRYTETDLNRCFTSALLSSPLTVSTPYEVRRAHELNAQLGPKGSAAAVDLLVDIHNTTSNMGLTIILYAVDHLPSHIYKYIQTMMAPVPVTAVQVGVSIADGYSLDSVGKHGLSIEVGPQPNGVLRADIYNMVKKAVDLTLEWVDKFNSGCTFQGGDVEVYNFVKSVDYPRDPASGEIIAAIHPELQDNDFKLLQPGDPMFLSFSGETVKHEGEALHPFFVNECAYYEKKIAFHLARKMTLTLPAMSVKSD